jgi:hypothetical protein
MTREQAEIDVDHTIYTLQRCIADLTTAYFDVDRHSFVTQSRLPIMDAHGDLGDLLQKINTAQTSRLVAVG